MRRKNVEVEVKTVKIRPQRKTVKRQPKRGGHQGAFIFGMILGAIAGGLAALFMTPKSGKEIRHELKDQAGGVQQLVTDVTSNVRGRSEGILGGAVDPVTRLAQRDGAGADEVVVVTDSEQTTMRGTVESPAVIVEDIDEESTSYPS
jgi:gas vesicle protein